MENEQWEYLTTKYATTSDIEFLYGGDLKSYFNTYGKEGWQLVNYEIHPILPNGVVKVYCTFKRNICTK